MGKPYNCVQGVSSAIFVILNNVAVYPHTYGDIVYCCHGNDTAVAQEVTPGQEVEARTGIRLTAPLSPCGEFGSSGTLYCTLLYFTTVLYCTLLLSLPPHPMLHLNIKSCENLCCGFSVMVDFIWITLRRTNGRTDGGLSKIRIGFYISKSP